MSTLALGCGPVPRWYAPTEDVRRRCRRCGDPSTTIVDRRMRSDVLEVRRDRERNGECPDCGAGQLIPKSTEVPCVPKRGPEDRRTPS